MSRHTELSKFSSNGKTFFFNRATASNGSPYLAVNALYGKGRQERIVLFEPHLMQFRRHLEEAIEELTGATFSSALAHAPAYEEPKIPEVCPDCREGAETYTLTRLSSGSIWIQCGLCGADIYQGWKDE